MTRSERPAATRLVAVALSLLFAAFATLYGWQAWVHSTPTIFTDELELTQLSRAIAETGHAARRGQPHSFNSLVTYLWAPAWRIDSTKTAYEVIKLLDVLVMTSVILPAYLLARSIASRWASVFAAAGSAAIPALSFSPMLLEEPLAYPWATWAFFLAVRAIATRSRGWIAGAVVVALLGNVVRGELSLLPAVLLLGAGLFAATSAPGKRRWAAWSRWDRAGAVTLFIGGLIFVNAALSQASQSWEISTRLYKGRIFDLGLQAATIFTIGVGVLPILAGLAVALSLRGATLERRTFLSVFWAALIAFSTYTAIKAAFLSTNFATRVEERNLFYLAPLLFAATAAWLDRPRVRIAPAAVSIVFVGFLLTWKEYQQLYPYFEAPGNGILALSNREFSWTPATQRAVLVGVLVFCGAVLLLPEALRLAGRVVPETWVWAGRGMLAALAAVVVGWSLTGEVYSAIGFRDGADQFVANLPKPLDWVDRATGHRPTVYYGQKLPPGPSGVWLTEFWNRSIEKVWSTDGTAPGPGPTVSPDLVKTDGTTWPSPGTDYALADNGVQLVGTTVARRGGLRLYRIHGPLRLAEAASFVDPDGWMGDYAKWADFVGRTPGTAVVSLSRQGFCADAPVGHALVRVSDLVIGKDRHEAPGRLRASKEVLVRNCKAVTVRLAAERPPFLVDVRIKPTFRLSDYGISDSRVVGAVVGFGFEPGRKAAQISVKR